MQRLLTFSLFHLCLLLPLTASSQWYISSDLPAVSRYDDIVFVSEMEGWTVNSAGEIYHTTDQGITWQLQKSTGDYLRSIEFVDATIGYCGSLDYSFYKTTDGGVTWTDIAPTITPIPEGICGISAPDANTVYGCGIWSSPAYIIKSTDGGNAWTTIDMSAYATALVDIEFSSPDVGFVVGTANPASNGGIILHTTDGGQTWTTKFITNVSLDYVWKIQSPDGIHFYASVDAVPVTNNLRILKSSDSGNTWTMDTILNTYVYTQLVGFINPNHGWLGANSNLYETTDGGVSWNQQFVGSSYNRFHKLSEDAAFLTGSMVYKYGGSQADIENPTLHDEVHELTVSPNPTNDMIHIDLTLHSKTRAQLMLIDAQGRVVTTFLNEIEMPNTFSFDYSLNDQMNQTFFVILKCNEGLVYRKVILQK